METPIRDCCSPSSPLPSPLVYSGGKLVDNRRGWLSSDELSDSSLQHKRDSTVRPPAEANSKPETPPHAPPCAVNPLAQKHGHIYVDYSVDQFVSDDGRQQQFSGTSHQVELKQSYRSTFKSDWSLKWPYILRSPGGDSHVFFCDICKKTVSCAHQGLRDVTRHLESSGHLDKMNLKHKLPQEHEDILSANQSLQALRDSGELSVVTTPPHDDDSDEQETEKEMTLGSPPPDVFGPLQTSQALAAANGQLNPALKDVQCPICFKVFSRKFSLEMHFLIHQGLKPYTCQHCGRSFRQKGTLMRHKAIHNQTPSYRCGLCDRSYRQKNVFLHHLRTRHKISTDMLDRRRSKSGGHDETGSPNSLLDSASPNGAIETVYPPPELPTSTPARPVSTESVSAEPVTSTLPGLPTPFHTPLPIPNGQLHNSLFLLGFLPFPPLNFSSPPPRNVSPQNSWRCPFCPFETLNEDTEGFRKHLLQHINESPHFCLSCGHRCMNEGELFAHIQDVHGPGRSSLGLGSALQAAVNRCYRSMLPDLGKEQDEPLSLSKVKEEPIQKQGPFSCIPCKADFSSEDDLECHVKSHGQILPDLPSSLQAPEDLSTNSSRKRSLESDDEAKYHHSKFHSKYHSIKSRQ